MVEGKEYDEGREYKMGRAEMNKLSEVLRLHLDVVVDVPFKLLGKGNDEYRIDSEGYGYRRCAGSKWIYENNLLLSLIAGKYIVDKPEFILGEGVRYYLVNTRGEIIAKIFDSSSTVDLLNYNIGNYFRDYRSAVLNRPLILDTFKRILNEVKERGGEKNGGKKEEGKA